MRKHYVERIEPPSLRDYRGERARASAAAGCSTNPTCAGTSARLRDRELRRVALGRLVVRGSHANLRGFKALAKALRRTNRRRPRRVRPPLDARGEVEKILRRNSCDWRFWGGYAPGSVRHGIGDVIEHDAKGES